MKVDQYLVAMGESFKARREKLMLTHEDVAEIADLNVNYYARIERGEINTSVKKLICIAAALDTDLSRLIADTEKRLQKRA